MAEAATAPRIVREYAHGRLRGAIRIFGELASTNTTLRELAASGEPDGLVVIADAQTSGRGRHGRVWNSPVGAGFYGSVLLRPRITAERIALVTLAAAVAVVDALTELGVRELEIKWPNDVLARRRKLSGILTEASFAGSSVEWVVVGIGVNVTEDAVPIVLAGQATSLEAEGVTTDNVGLADPLLRSLAVWIDRLEQDGSVEVISRWSSLAPMSRGHEVAVADGRDAFTGITTGIDGSGALLVRKHDGSVAALQAGDVTLRRVH